MSTNGTGARAAGGRFAPGSSGNPGGRPKMTAAMREAISLARDATPRAMERLIELTLRTEAVL